MPLDNDAEAHILAEIAGLRQDILQGRGTAEDHDRRLRELGRTVHETYAGGAGIGPRTLQLEAAMSTPNGPGSAQKTGWYDNVERGFSALLKNSIGKTLAATLFIVALGFAVTLGILAFKGELDDVIRGAWTPGKEVVDVPEGTVVDEPPPGDPGAADGAEVVE